MGGRGGVVRGNDLLDLALCRVQTMTVKPQGIQRKRTKGYDMQAESMALNGLPCVSVCRPGRWGNHHRVGWCELCGETHTAAQAVEEYRQDIGYDAQMLIQAQLAGHNLACFCNLGEPCHRDVLLAIANGGEG